MADPVAKHDTEYLANAATPTFAQLATDLTDHDQDFTDATTYCWLSSGSASRFALSDDGATIGVRVDLDNTSSGYGYSMTAGGTVRWGWQINGSGSLLCVIGNLVVSTIALPAVGVTADTFVIHWAMTPNVLTTGASDAWHSEVRIWNETESDRVGGANFSHAEPDLTSCQVVWGARNISGSSTLGEDMHDVLWSSRFHSVAEAHNDWIAPDSSRSFDSSTPIEVPTPDLASNFGDDGEFAGPHYAMAVAGTAANALTTASPAVNLVFVESPWMTNSHLLDQYWDDDFFGATSYDAALQYTFLRPVPAAANYLKCRLHVQLHDPEAEDDYRLNVRIYSANRPPLAGGIAQVGDPLPPQAVTYADTQQLQAEHGSGTTGGAWIDFDPIRVSRTPDREHTMLVIAWHLDDPSVHGGLSNAAVRFRALSVEPLQTLDTSPGVPDGIGL